LNLDRIREVAREEWQPVSAARLLAFSAAVMVLLYLLKFDDDGFIIFLDHANLAFHEAGHPIFGLLGDTPGLYGGTLGQLVFPVVAIILFWSKREATSFALGWVWLLENFHNIARYMADARVQVLPLVGGGDHDWANIFTRWGVLQSDTRIAGFVSLVGVIGILAVWLWLALRWMRSGTG
jgi:hypothetical protein